jgi:hypothetical protein
MNKMLGLLAAVMLMASQAGAATISGLGQTVTVEQGKSYTFYFDTGPVALVENSNLFIMRLTLPNGVVAERGGSSYPVDNRFAFDWVFGSLGSTTLNMSAILISYANVPIEELASYTGALVNFPGLFGRTSKAESFTASRVFEVVQAGQVSVVPIGGTLPLMATALGLFGWAARRRAKQSALPI